MSIENIDEKQVKIIQEDKIKVIKSRNTALYRENTRLKKQLSDETKRVTELEKQLGNLVKTRTEANSESTSQILPSDILQNSTSKLCGACKIQLCQNVTQESGIFITKSELEKLDQDVQTLRNALAVKELALSQLAEREQNYCRQLTRLAEDVISANQLADNRYNELETMARQLETFDGDEGEGERIESPAENNSQSEEEIQTEHQELLIMSNDPVSGN